MAGACTPIQAYAQPFESAGDYRAFKVVRDPRPSNEGHGDGFEPGGSFAIGRDVARLFARQATKRRDAEAQLLA